MTLFQDILHTVTKRLLMQEHDLEQIAACVSAATHVTVSASQLCIKKGTLYVQVPPTLKLAILSKKEEILKQCKEQLIGVYAIA